ncbi:MAG: DUF4412 domain-containing protein [Desulfarculaceae bacterium]|nr:DUF4412 domain-containing protein [Desulfarculaceae bacterium]MCF8048052.1 DUF4412 domain-containing protein [Desulfarculaceae bacterium]MCF8064905.1 DUF4412 domain-containing protein [Desulfarculaceae bacterium]MCF8097688.1 DUF4412 domain-containing protein [Desulfarculaceae bacterium]MCF8123718.1 DUF4412 domain-containing protein [Desulfarculaceae bacterium]
MKLRIGMAALMLLLTVSTAQAGWILHQETPGGPSTMYVQDNQVRAGMGQGGMVYDLNNGTVTMLNPSRQAYWSGKPQQLNQQMNQALDARMEQALKKAPPERREQMRAMMERQMGRGGKGQSAVAPPAAQVKVKNTGEKAKIAGYQATKYQVYVDGKLRQEMWVAQVPGFIDEMDMGKMMKLAHSMRAGTPGPGLGWRRSEAVQKLMSQGMPMKIVEYRRGAPMTVMTMTKVEKKKLPASTFQPPAGWKQVDFSQMMH